MGVRTGHKVHVFTRRKSYDELFDERADVLVADDGALPLFHAEHGFGHSHLQVAFHLALAAQTVVVEHFLACEMLFLHVQNLASAT